MNTVQAEQEIASGTRASGRARVSAPRSRVKHVEVLVKIRWLALLILGDLDPYPPTITWRALPPPDVRRATYLDEGWHQSTPMPSMPNVAIEDGVKRLRVAEVALRTKSDDMPVLEDLGASYWDDLIRLLLAYRAGTVEELSRIRASLASDFFKIYLTDRLPRLEENDAR